MRISGVASASDFTTSRRDRRHAHQHRTEGAVDDRADLVRLQPEGGFGDGLIREPCPWRRCRAACRRRSCPAPSTMESKRRAGADRIERRLRGFLVREDELLDGARLRRGEARDVLVVVLLHLRIGDGGFVGDLLRHQRDIGDLAVFGRRVGLLVVLEIGRERRVRRLLDRLDQRLRQHDVFRRTVLAAIERHGAQEGVRRLQPVRTPPRRSAGGSPPGRGSAR